MKDKTHNQISERSKERKEKQAFYAGMMPCKTWENQFKPEKVPETPEGRKLLSETDGHFIWTLISNEYGGWHVVSGFRFCNSMNYFISPVSHNGKEILVNY